jgi:RNA polymerase sigma-70 factor (ECF subfamily)
MTLVGAESLENADAFRSHSRDVYRWALRVVGRHEDALDVVQDVFVAWTRTPRRPPMRSPRGWLRTATINRAIDLCRRRTVRDGRNQSLRLVRSAPGESEDASRPAEREELRSRVSAALAELTELQRTVLVSKVYDDLTFAEIAMELERTVPTVKTHYLRALRAMRDRLDPGWLEERTP